MRPVAPRLPALVAFIVVLTLAGWLRSAPVATALGAPADPAPIASGHECSIPATSVVVGPAVAAARATVEVDPPAAQLRVALGQLLAEHAFLTMESMRAIALTTPDGDSLRTALDQNSQSLSTAFGGVYGPDAATRFADLWRQHVDLLIAYASAKAHGDAADAQVALDGLATFRRTFADFLAAANPKIDAQAEAEALRLHIAQLIAFADTDYAKAYAAEREAFTHMFGFGDQLALAIGRQFPTRFAGADVAFSPAADLRLALDRLLGEHLVLSAEAMRARLASAPDSSAARDALSANSDDLAGAIARSYGNEAGAAFGSLWSEHVAAYLRFVDAVASGDAAAREAALMSLHDYHDRLAKFLAAANPYLSAPVVAAMIQRHVQALITMVEAYDAGDNARSIATIRDAYRRMFEVGDAIAAAIVRQFPDRFRDLRAVPATSTAEGTTGRSPEPRLGFAALLVALAAGLLGLSSVPSLGRRLRRGR